MKTDRVLKKVGPFFKSEEKQNWDKKKMESYRRRKQQSSYNYSRLPAMNEADEYGMYGENETYEFDAYPSDDKPSSSTTSASLNQDLSAMMDTAHRSVSGNRFYNFTYMSFCKLFHFEYFLSPLSRLAVMVHQTLSLAAVAYMVYMIVILRNYFYRPNNTSFYLMDTVVLLSLLIPLCTNLLKFVALASDPSSTRIYYLEAAHKMFEQPLMLYTVAIVFYFRNVDVFLFLSIFLMLLMMTGMNFVISNHVFFDRINNKVLRFRRTTYGALFELRDYKGWGFNQNKFYAIVVQGYKARLKLWVHIIWEISNGVRSNKGSILQNVHQMVTSHSASGLDPEIMDIKHHMCNYCKQDFELRRDKTATMGVVDNGCKCNDTYDTAQDKLVSYVRQALRRTSGEVTHDVYDAYVDNLPVNQHNPIMSLSKHDGSPFNLAKTLGLKGVVGEKLSTIAKAVTYAMNQKAVECRVAKGSLYYGEGKVHKSLLNEKEVLPTMDEGLSRNLSNAERLNPEAFNANTSGGKQETNLDFNEEELFDEDGEFDADDEYEEDESEGEDEDVDEESDYAGNDDGLDEMTVDELNKIYKAMNGDETDETTTLLNKNEKMKKNKTAETKRKPLNKTALIAKIKEMKTEHGTKESPPRKSSNTSLLKRARMYGTIGRRTSPKDSNKFEKGMHILNRQVTHTAGADEGMRECCWWKRGKCKCTTYPHLGYRNKMDRLLSQQGIVNAGYKVLLTQMIRMNLSIKEVVDMLPAMHLPDDLYSVSRCYNSWNLLGAFINMIMYILITAYFILGRGEAPPIVAFVAYTISIVYDLYFYQFNDSRLRSALLLHGFVVRVSSYIGYLLLLYSAVSGYQDIYGI